MVFIALFLLSPDIILNLGASLIHFANLFLFIFWLQLLVSLLGTKFTDLFTIKYANDAMRRTVRFKDKRAHDVDPGIREMPLHSEASYSPSWPEIIWFYCNKAPKNSGSTTISDGQTIYKKR